MKFKKQNINNLILIEPEPYSDERGMFRRNFCEKEFKENDLEINIAQANISENYIKHTLRGFHYQIEPYGETKTLSCIVGSIYNVVIDLRKNSPTYLEYSTFNLDEKNKYSLQVPSGCANAFLTLEQKTIVHYYCSQKYNPDAERGIRYNDPILNINWPHEPSVISQKDLNHPNYEKK